MHGVVLMSLSSVALMLAAGEAGQQEAQGERTFALEEGRAARTLTLGRGVAIPAEPGPLKGLCGVPESVSDEVLYGAFPLGASSDTDGESRSLFFALDKRSPESRRYDRLYLDLDQDGDLSDEDSRRISTKFELEFDLGEGYGKRPVELKPRVRNPRDGSPTLSLYATVARQGKIEIAGKEYEVTLGQGPQLGGRYDLPDCAMRLRPRSDLPGQERLDSGRLIGGKYYVFSATRDGSHLTVRPYDGDLGVFRVGAQGREVGEIEASGYLLGDFDAPIGRLDDGGDAEPARECQIPVGSYRPHDLTVRYGALTVDVSRDNYSRKDPGESAEFPIEIRKDRPYVLDFSDQLEIRFLTPEPLQRFERGDEIRIEALLTYPNLGILVTDIERWGEGRRPGTWKRRGSLDPTISVRDSAGTVRATGKMPFG